MWAGNPAYAETKKTARDRKTKFYETDRKAFVSQLVLDMESLVRKCDKLGLKPAARLNGTSDIAWEIIAPELFNKFPQVTYYDYTKLAGRTLPGWSLPPNYTLVLSWNGYNAKACFDCLGNNGKIAIPFAGYGRTQPLLNWYKGFPVVDGDTHDLTFLRPSGTILGLRAKGVARSHLNRFIVRPQAEERFETINAIRGYQ
jgi:hypothetical protein